MGQRSELGYGNFTKDIVRIDKAQMNSSATAITLLNDDAASKDATCKFL